MKLAIFLGLALIVAGCSRSGDPESAAESTIEIETETSAADPDLLNSPAVTRLPANPGTADGGWWIRWTLMDKASIEVEWSPAEEGATYELFRIESIGANPEEDPLEEADRVYVGSNQRYFDSTVVEGTFYTYIVIAQSDPETRKWTETLAKTDTVPPPKITGLEAQRSDEGIVLRWDESSDETEFAAYSVSIVGDDDELFYVGGGADESQTVFVDNQAENRRITYVVQAVDFHNNRSEPVRITVP